MIKSKNHDRFDLQLLVESHLDAAGTAKAETEFSDNHRASRGMPGLGRLESVPGPAS